MANARFGLNRARLFRRERDATGGDSAGFHGTFADVDDSPQRATAPSCEGAVRQSSTSVGQNLRGVPGSSVWVVFKTQTVPVIA